uniref:Gnk2-homologous domain-containing protein n=1 Tax=Zea mays TaxID=4577 RepID=A0A804MRK6_MAIZE
MILAALLLLLSFPKQLAGSQSVCSSANIVYMQSSTYMSNLNALAGALFAKVTSSNSHSAHGTAGTGSDMIYGAVLCRGDMIPGAACAKRLKEVLDAAMDNPANSSCSSQKDITLFDDGYLVQLRFSDQDFISNFRDSQECVVRANLNPPLLGDVSEQFHSLVSKLMTKLTDAAVKNMGRYETGQGWLTEKSQTVYGLVQCQEDMLKGTCQDCLSSAMAKREQMVDQMGGAILGVGCSLWYQTEVQFFAGTPALSLNMPTREDYEAIERCIQVALLCVQENAEDRPAMDLVVNMLNNESVILPKPKQPAYFFTRSSESEVSSCNMNISITLER